MRKVRAKLIKELALKSWNIDPNDHTWSPKRLYKLLKRKYVQTKGIR